MRDLEPGDPQRLGDHKLVGVLGTGGFGRVYAARAPNGRMLAVKAAHPHLARADPQFTTRFAAVMGDLSRVRNLDGGRIVQWDADDIRPWYARRYVPGASLVELLGECRALPDAARYIAGRAARALRAMHEAELPHGAVTAGNLLVTASAVQLVDGGLVRMFPPGAPLIPDAYVPPEGADGTIAADLYALGVLIAVCATGVLPGGPHAAGVGKRLQQPLRSVVRALTDPDPAARPDTTTVIHMLQAPRTLSSRHLPPAAGRAIARHTTASAATEDPGARPPAPAEKPTADKPTPGKPTVGKSAPKPPRHRPVTPPAPRARKLWQAPVPGARFLHAVDGTVYAVGDGITAFDARTADVKWTKPGWQIVAVQYEGSVCCTRGTRIAMLDGATGQEKWRTDVSAVRGIWARGAGRLARAERAFRVHAVYRPTRRVLVAVGGHSELFALDAETGALLWNRREPRRTVFARDAASRIYLSGDRREPVRALDPATGDVAWESGHEDAIVVAVARDRVLCGRISPGAAEPDQHVVRAADSGKAVHTDDQPGEAAFLDDDGVLYDIARRGFRAVDTAAGQEKWRIPWPGRAGVTVAPSGHEAYLRDDNGRVHAVDLAAGTVTWVAGQPQRHSDAVGRSLDRALGVTVDDNVVYLRRHTDPALTAFDRNDGRELWYHPALYGTFTMVEPVAEAGLVHVVLDDVLMAFTAPDTGSVRH